MWCNDPPIQPKNKTTKRAVGVKVGGDGEGVWTKSEEGGMRRDRKYREFFIKKGGARNPVPTMICPITEWI